MDRREVLRTITYMTGFAVSAPVASALLSGCKAEPTPEGTTYQPEFLNEEEFSFISEVSEGILPKTDTPGAKEVGVPEYIDRVVAQIYAPEDQERFRQGLKELMDKANTELGKPITDLTSAELNTYVAGLDTGMKAQWETWEATPPASEEEARQRYNAFQDLKQLTIGGYFSTQEVATTQLAYDPVPGEWIGCGNLQDLTGGKAWALD
jgi:hypothetical protein